MQFTGQVGLIGEAELERQQGERGVAYTQRAGRTHHTQSAPVLGDGRADVTTKGPRQMRLMHTQIVRQQRHAEGFAQGIVDALKGAVEARQVGTFRRDDRHPRQQRR